MHTLGTGLPALQQHMFRVGDAGYVAGDDTYISESDPDIQHEHGSDSVCAQ